MIRAEVISRDEYCQVGDIDDDENIHSGCVTVISFGGEGIQVMSRKGDEELCTIFISHSDYLVADLRKFIDVYEYYMSREE